MLEHLYFLLPQPSTRGPAVDPIKEEGSHLRCHFNQKGIDMDVQEVLPRIKEDWG